MHFSRTALPQKGNCFVIMPFGEKVLRGDETFNWDDHYRDVIAPTIEQAKMTPIRADEIYGPPKLMDAVWRGIQEAEVVIADLTGRSPNVLYEVGLAHIIGKRFLIVTMDPDDVPADLAEFRQLRYSTDGRSLLIFVRELQKSLTAVRQEKLTEMNLTPILQFGGAEKVQATVLAVAPSFATVGTDDGRRGFLDIKEYSWTRRRDLSRLLHVGDVLNGTFIVDLDGQQKYSLIAGEENPWTKLASEFPIDSTFTGIVNSYRDNIGAFVRMKYEIDGLIPRTHLQAPLPEGAVIEVRMVKIDTEQREVLLRFVRLIKGADWPFRTGQRYQGRLVRFFRDRGFALVQIEAPDGTSVTGLLPATKMSPSFRARFIGSELQEGDDVGVEVVETKPVEKKVTFREIGDAPTITPHDAAAGLVQREDAALAASSESL